MSCGESELSHWGGVKESFLEAVALGLVFEDGWDVSKRWAVGWERTPGPAWAQAWRWGDMQSSVGMRQHLCRGFICGETESSQMPG